MQTSSRTPLYNKIKSYLYSLIAQNLLDGKTSIPSEVSLAIQFNISRTTSRRAFHDLVEEGFLVRKKGCGTFIKTPLSDKNQEFLEKYKFDQSKNIPPTTRKTVAVIFPDIKSKYMMKILDGIQTLATKNEWDVIFATSNYEQDLESALIRKFLPYSHGLIIFPVNKTTYNKEIIKLTLKNFPLVVIDNLLHGVETSSITSDNKKTTHKIVQHLLKEGKRHIGIISNPFESAFSLKERYRGYQEALSENNLPIDKSLILNTLEHYDDKSTLFIKKFLHDNPQLDAVISFNYELGIKTLETIKGGFNLLTASDLFIFDEEFEDFYTLLQYKPNYIKQNAFLIGNTAFSIILEKHNNPDYLNRHIVILEEIFYRNSI
jgi:DNA-binding LacI/PurR family transcriptional regulator